MLLTCRFAKTRALNVCCKFRCIFPRLCVEHIYAARSVAPASCIYAMDIVKASVVSRGAHQQMLRES